MGDDLQPVASVETIELPAQLRLDAWRQLEFDHSGTRLALEYMVDARAFPWLSEHSVDVALPAGLGAAAMLLWVTRRIIRRPRTVGRTYCRRCGYDLTPPEGAILCATCHECGQRTLGRALQGRRLRPWHFALPMLFLGCVIACAGICYEGLSSMQTALAPSAWPIASIESGIRGWPLWRIKCAPSWESRCASYSLGTDGRLHGHPWIVPMHPAWRFSSDGSHLVSLEFSQRGGWIHRALIHDFAARTSRTVDFGTATDGFFQLAAVAAHGTSALVIQTLLVGAAGEADTKLLQLDLATGVLTAIASTTVPSWDGGGSPLSYSTPPMSACVSQSQAIPWALVVHDLRRLGGGARGARGGSLLIVGTAEGERRIPIPHVMGVLPTSFTCVIADDDTVVINGSLSVHVRAATFASNPKARFDVIPTDDPHTDRLVEYEIRMTATLDGGDTGTETERGTIAMLDTRPQAPPKRGSPYQYRPLAAFSPRSGICALECADGAADAPRVLRVWRLTPQLPHGQ